MVRSYLLTVGQVLSTALPHCKKSPQAPHSKPEQRAQHRSALFILGIQSLQATRTVPRSSPAQLLLIHLKDLGATLEHLTKFRNTSKLSIHMSSHTFLTFVQHGLKVWGPADRSSHRTESVFSRRPAPANGTRCLAARTKPRLPAHSLTGNRIPLALPAAPYLGSLVPAVLRRLLLAGRRLLAGSLLLPALRRLPALGEEAAHGGAAASPATENRRALQPPRRAPAGTARPGPRGEAVRDRPPAQRLAAPPRFRLPRPPPSPVATATAGGPGRRGDLCGESRGLQEAVPSFRGVSSRVSRPRMSRGGRDPQGSSTPTPGPTQDHRKFKPCVF